ncbi:hypothetical protein QR680_015880 [Steinernema hermaphroditum]|uniref:XRN2-binding (XTBD) domain-containing protein n=1 Tax=Steinernema hermaphroditum TaxID=289476 RepID=A0AA39HAC0_9BILA|nr:hypothetical protein QR680_015880 [Steinernema hermaphroditum]
MTEEEDPHAWIEGNRNSYETERQWSRRRAFLREYASTFEKQRLISLSFVYSNIKAVNCKYDKSLMKQVLSMGATLSEDATTGPRAELQKLKQVKVFAKQPPSIVEHRSIEKRLDEKCRPADQMGEKSSVEAKKNKKKKKKVVEEEVGDIQKRSAATSPRAVMQKQVKVLTKQPPSIVAHWSFEEQVDKKCQLVDALVEKPFEEVKKNKKKKKAVEKEVGNIQNRFEILGLHCGDGDRTPADGLNTSSSVPAINSDASASETVDLKKLHRKDDKTLIKQVSSMGVTLSEDTATDPRAEQHKLKLKQVKVLSKQPPSVVEHWSIEEQVDEKWGPVDDVVEKSSVEAKKNKKRKNNKKKKKAVEEEVEEIQNRFETLELHCGDRDRALVDGFNTPSTVPAIKNDASASKTVDLKNMDCENDKSFVEQVFMGATLSEDAALSGDIEKKVPSVVEHWSIEEGVDEVARMLSKGDTLSEDAVLSAGIKKKAPRKKKKKNKKKTKKRR